MSEKTLGEMLYYRLSNGPVWHYQAPYTQQRWQAAADAIAAPLLARIAELEGEVDWAHCPECGSREVAEVPPAQRTEKGHRYCRACKQEFFSTVDYSDVVAINLSRLTCENATLRAEVERRKAMVCPTCGGAGERTVFSGQTPDSYQEDTVECPDCVGVIKEEAYQRGVAEERERCAKVAEGLTRFLSCGGGNGHGIAESIRSASPAVDVTSDKGGGR